MLNPPFLDVIDAACPECKDMNKLALPAVSIDCAQCEAVNLVSDVTNFTLNGYSIRFNPMWNEWQTNHVVAGVSEAYRDLKECLYSCYKG
jgi:LSD1 subclass zinc finger protein